jgi:predicted AAA+ superfamily ATPase
MQAGNEVTGGRRNVVDVTPWWRALRIRKEILNAAGQIDDVQMSLFQAAYGTGSARPLYAEAAYFGEITHPTGRLVDLLTEIAVRIGAGEDHLKARAVTRLDQGMGGGKSHACIGAYHLATNPRALFATELGKAVAAQARARLGRELPLDLGGPHVVVLPCDNMTPGAPVKEFDGPAESLYERFLWRLFGKDYALYERYQPYFNDKSQIANALRAVHCPVLVIIDEVSTTSATASKAQPNRHGSPGRRVPASILDVVNDVPTFRPGVMIASDRDKTA